MSRCTLPLKWSCWTINNQQTTFSVSFSGFVGTLFQQISHTSATAEISNTFADQDKSGFFFLQHDFEPLCP